MNPDDVIGLVFPLLIILGIGAAIGGGIYLLQAARRGDKQEFPIRALFRLYLAMLSIVTLLLMVGGVAHLANAAFSTGLGREFSYSPLYVGSEFGPRVPLSRGEVLQGEQNTLQLKQNALDKKEAALQLKQDATQEERDATQAQQTLLDQERAALQEEWAIYQEEQDVLQEERDRKGLKRAFQEGLLRGGIFTVFGGILWGAHVWGRKRIETPEERQGGLLNRLYLLILLLIFGIITVTSLPGAAFESMRFYFFDDVFHRPPGRELATALITLPVWLLYLRGTIQSIRS